MTTDQKSVRPQVVNPRVVQRDPVPETARFVAYRADLAVAAVPKGTAFPEEVCTEEVNPGFYVSPENLGLWKVVVLNRESPHVATICYGYPAIEEKGEALRRLWIVYTDGFDDGVRRILNWDESALDPCRVVSFGKFEKGVVWPFVDRVESQLPTRGWGHI